MTTWVIGDVQGHEAELKILIDKLNLQDKDRLWFVGDLVNRGPRSLEVLRTVKNFGERASVVLGNHDLALITTYYGHRELKAKSDLVPIMQAPDKEELMEWLVSQPLVHFDHDLNACMIHAGLYPQWSISDALTLNQEYLSIMAHRRTRESFLKVMFGDTPTQWNESLPANDRMRFFVNACTRMRCLDQEGHLDFGYSGDLDQIPNGLTPWFRATNFNTTLNAKLYFGHWAALHGNCPHPSIVNTDTGCCWGGTLSATNIETGARVEVAQITPYRLHPDMIILSKQNCV